MCVCVYLLSILDVCRQIVFRDCIWKGPVFLKETGKASIEACLEAQSSLRASSWVVTKRIVHFLLD